ncbi:MAG: TAXI family TRAP transporter solute-binding subunit [Gammaproteobacteria bacterium]
MKSIFKKGLLTVAAASLVLSSGISQAAGNYILATASTGGTFYPVGVALATLSKVKLQPKHNVGMSAINSAGSGENVKLMRENEAQFAILQGLYGSYAWNGTGPIASAGKQEYMRSVTMLWQNVEQFVIASEHAGTGTIMDLAKMNGMKMAMGKQNSGTIGSNRKILANLGIDMDANFELVHAGYGPSAEALQDGRVAGVGIPAGVPTGAITKLFAAAKGKVTPLKFTPALAKKADGGLNLWTPYTIKARTYSGQNEDWNTIAQPNFLAVRADVSEEDVYLLTKTIYENLPFLGAIHKATKAMSLESSIAGLPAPLHPGAARYYKEVGLSIPSHLQP